MLLEPVSLANATVGATTVLSKVNVKVLVLDTLPTTSVWRTNTLCVPSARPVGAVVVQAPPTLYSTKAPASGVTLSVSTDVILSAAEPAGGVPVSVSKLTTGVVGATVSKVKVMAVDAEELPATSCWRT